MSSQRLPLKTADGWRTGPAVDTGWSLVWRSGGQLKRAGADFSRIETLGSVGTVDCPLAVNAGRSEVYRYACGETGSRRDFSEIRAFPLDGRQPDRLFALDRRKWIVWLCHFLPEAEVLLALVASEAPGRHLNIQHQLGFFDLRQHRSLLVNLPRDAFAPLAVDAPRRRVLFHGAEGFQLVDFTGKRLARLSGESVPEGRGADFHPTQPVVALGGGELTLWRIDRQRFERLAARGVNPVWSKDGQSLLFRPHSGALAVWSAKSETADTLFEIAASRFPEQHHARPAVLSPDGRLAAVPVARRIRRDTENGATHVDKHALIIADFETRTLWQTNIHAENLAWAKGEE
ncbi:MAG: hypothetical protein ACFB21_03920 [Opitutales bacterium]